MRASGQASLASTRGLGGVEGRGLFVASEAQALVGGEVAVVFEVVALQPRVALHCLTGADEAEAGVAQAYAVMGVPAAQHGAGDLAGHGAQGGAVPHPARRRVAHPGFAVALAHPFDVHAADRVGEVVVLGGGDGVRLGVQAELAQARQEQVEMLAAEDGEDEAGGVVGAAPRDRGQHHAGEEGVVPFGHGLPGARLDLVLGLVDGVVRHCCAPRLSP